MFMSVWSMCPAWVWHVRHAPRMLAWPRPMAPDNHWVLQACSDLAAFMTGSTLAADAGSLAR